MVGLYWEILRFAADGKIEEFVEKAREVKNTNYSLMMEKGRENSVADTLLAQLVPDLEWQGGWWDGVTSVRPATQAMPVRLSADQKARRALSNEVLCKVLCHNVCVLIQAIQEFGIESTFEELTK